MKTTITELNQAAVRGVEACKKGQWKEGLAVLGKIAEADRQGAELHGQFYSYLGYGIARYERRVKEGLALCQHSIKVQFYEPENYVNLARVYLLARNRRKAVDDRRQRLRPEDTVGHQDAAQHATGQEEDLPPDVVGVVVARQNRVGHALGGRP